MSGDPAQAIAKETTAVPPKPVPTISKPSPKTATTLSKAPNPTPTLAKSAAMAAATVTLLSIAERFFGFLYRVVLSRKLGAEGMGLYYIALSVFAVFVTVAASGVPITVSRLMVRFRTEGNEKKASGVVTAGVLVALCYSIPAAILLFLLRNSLGSLFTDERCVLLFICMLPGLIVNSVYAVLRGAFWGDGRFTVYAVIELVEEIVMVAVGTVAISLTVSRGKGEISAAVAVTVSYFASFLLATALYLGRGRRFTSPKGTLKPLLSSALPITGMRTAGSFLNSFIAVLLPLRLIAAGLSPENAVKTYAAASAMAVPILFAPSTIIGSVSLVMGPRLSGEFYGNKKSALRTTAETSLKAAVLLACLMIPAVFVGGADLCLLLYRNGEAGAYVEKFALLLLPMSLSMMTTGILNSMGYEKHTLLFFLSGSAGMLLSVWFLPNVLGAEALLVGFSLSFSVSAALSLCFLQKKCRAVGRVLPFALQNVAVLLPTLFFGRCIRNLSAALPRFLAMSLAVTAAFVFQIVLLAAFGTVRLSAFGKRKRAAV